MAQQGGEGAGDRGVLGQWAWRPEGENREVGMMGGSRMPSQMFPGNSGPF